VQEWGDFVAVTWEIWNAKNLCLFGSPDQEVNKLTERAISFVGSCRDACDHLGVSDKKLLDVWTLPPSGTFKVNFNGAKLGDWDHSPGRCGSGWR